MLVRSRKAIAFGLAAVASEDIPVSASQLKRLCCLKETSSFGQNFKLEFGLKGKMEETLKSFSNTVKHLDGLQNCSHHLWIYVASVLAHRFR